MRGIFASNLYASNVFSILPSAQKYIEKNGLAIIQGSLLEAVVVRHTLSIKEANLLKAVNLWATNECETHGSKTDVESKRKILGESIVKGIRFPLMKKDKFSNIIIDSKILRTEEVLVLFKYYSSALNSSMEFLD